MQSPWIVQLWYRNRKTMQPTTAWVRHLWLCRFPLIFLAILISFGPLILINSPHSIANGLLISSDAQAAAVTAISLFTSLSLFMQLHFLLCRAPYKFDDLKSIVGKNEHTRSMATWIEQHIRFWTLSIVICGLIFPVVCCAHSLVEAGENFEDEASLTVPKAFSGIILGVLGFLIAVQLVAAFSSHLKPWLNDTSVLPQTFRIPFIAIAQWFAPIKREALKPTDASVRFLARFELTLVFIILLSLYFWLYATTTNREVAPDDTFTTPFYLVFRLAILASVLGGVAYLCDNYRTPTLFLVLVLFAITYTAMGIDHHFELIRVPTSTPSLTVPTSAEESDVAHTEIIVTAPGGGIHAASWTGQVLVGLHEEYGDKFSNNLKLISAVSGGAVGAMFYLDGFDAMQRHAKQLDPAIATDDLSRDFSRIRRRSSTSCLESLAWGMTFPDTMRFFLSSFVNEDRGTSQERRWLARMDIDVSADWPQQDSPTLREWKQIAESGKLPHVVFNATEAETGKRVLFSTLGAKYFTAENINAKEAPINFLDAAGDTLDIGVATATRLSATFPYITPAAMPPKNTVPIGHIVDGGYVDNEGLLTVVEYIRYKAKTSQQPIKFVVVRIMHTPPDEPHLVGANDAGLDNSGLRYASLGPLVAINNVRAASQRERGELELDLLKTTLANGEHQVQDVTIQYNLPSHPQPPLNWKLSPKQRATYPEAWKKFLDEGRTQRKEAAPSSDRHPLVLLDEALEK